MEPTPPELGANTGSPHGLIVGLVSLNLPLWGVAERMAIAGHIQ